MMTHAIRQMFDQAYVHAEKIKKCQSMHVFSGATGKLGKQKMEILLYS